MKRTRTWLLATTLLVGLIPAIATAASPEKTEICHFNADDDPHASRWELLEINAKSLVAHLAHSDGFPGGIVPGSDGELVFDETCTPTSVERIFTIAYVDLNGSDGFDTGDRLISKLIDGPGAAADGLVGAGDLVVTSEYPRDLDASSFGSLAMTKHVVDGVNTATSEFCDVTVGSDVFQWAATSEFEGYSEGPSPGLTETFLLDLFGPTPAVQFNGDVISIDPESPSQPPENLLVGPQTMDVDDAFIDVDLDC